MKYKEFSLVFKVQIIVNMIRILIKISLINFTFLSLEFKAS